MRCPSRADPPRTSFLMSPFVNSPSSPQKPFSYSESSVAGSSASSSLSNVHPQARTLSSALGVQGGQMSPSGQSTYQPMNLLQPIASPQYQHNDNRTMSVEMSDESGVTPKGAGSMNTGRDSVADEERMREKAREAQEQVCRPILTKNMTDLGFLPVLGGPSPGQSCPCNSTSSRRCDQCRSHSSCSRNRRNSTSGYCQGHCFRQWCHSRSADEADSRSLRIGGFQH